VGKVRKAKEATGEVSPVDKRVGADGKARKQPAKRRKVMRLGGAELERLEQAGIVIGDACLVNDAIAEGTGRPVTRDKVKAVLAGNGGDPEATAKARKAVHAAMEAEENGEPARASDEDEGESDAELMRKNKIHVFVNRAQVGIEDAEMEINPTTSEEWDMAIEAAKAAAAAWEAVASKLELGRRRLVHFPTGPSRPRPRPPDAIRAAARVAPCSGSHASLTSVGERGDNTGRGHHVY
jgi:hypothetical protein